MFFTFLNDKSCTNCPALLRSLLICSYPFCLSVSLLTSRLICHSYSNCVVFYARTCLALICLRWTRAKLQTKASTPIRQKDITAFWNTPQTRMQISHMHVICSKWSPAKYDVEIMGMAQTSSTGVLASSSSHFYICISDGHDYTLNVRVILREVSWLTTAWNSFSPGKWSRFIEALFVIGARDGGMHGWKLMLGGGRWQRGGWARGVGRWLSLGRREKYKEGARAAEKNTNKRMNNK